jgi:hypothetical protein
MAVGELAGIRLIERKLQGARGRYVVAALLHGAGTVAVWFFGLAALSLAADYFLHLEPGGRLLLVVVYGVLLAVAAGRWLVTPVVAAPDDDELALRVEAKHRNLKSALISTVQLARLRPEELGSVSPQLIAALEEDTAARTRHLNFASVVPLREPFAAVLLAVLVASGAWLFAQAYAVVVLTWADRFLHPLASTASYPTRTRIDVLTVGGVVAKGEDVDVVVIAHGEVPQAGTLSFRSQGASWQQAPLVPVKDQPGRFSCTLERLLETTEYSVALGDARSETFELLVVPRPRVTEVTASYRLPDYAGGEARQSVTGDVDVLAGTWVDVTAKTNKPVVAARLELDGASTTMEADREGVLRARFGVSANGTYRIRLRDDFGLEDRDPVVHLVRALEDRPPKVTIHSPGRDRDMTPEGFLPIQFEVTDDFGVSEVQLRYTVEKALATGVTPAREAAAASSPAAPAAQTGAVPATAATAAPGAPAAGQGAPPAARQGPAPSGGEAPAPSAAEAQGALTSVTVPVPGHWQGKAAQGRYVLELEPLGLTEGDTVVYSIRAADNRSIDPQVDRRNWADSRQYQVHVVSSQAKREELRLREEEALREIQLLIDKQKESKAAVQGLIPQPAQ